MKRRTFVAGLGAAGLCAPWITAGGNPLAEPEFRTLVPVFDRLPEALAAEALAALPQVMGAFPEKAYPLVIGLGEAAQPLVDQARTNPLLPLDLGLYRTGAASAHGATDWLSQRLDSCHLGVLLVDAADPRALAECREWASNLADYDVFLRVAVLLNTSGSAEQRGRRAAVAAQLINSSGPRQPRGGTFLHGVVEVWTRGATLGAAQTVQFLLPGLAFELSDTIGDRGKAAWLLSEAPEARTTAVCWEHEPILPAAFANACGPLDPQGCSGAILLLHAGPDFTADERDALHRQCDRLLPRRTERVIAVMVHPDWAKRRRVLSLTLLGEWDGTWPVGSSLYP